MVIYDIDSDKAKKRELIKISGSSSIPFIDIEGTYLVGYSPTKIKQTIESKR